MICEPCRQHRATEHLSRITETTITVAELCRQCFIEVSGPLDLDEVRSWIKAEAELGSNLDWTTLAREWIERATVHEQDLPPEIADFLQRRGPGGSG